MPIPSDDRLRELAYKACYWPGHKMGLPRERCRECLRTLEALRTAQAEERKRMQFTPEAYRMVISWACGHEFRYSMEDSQCPICPAQAERDQEWWLKLRLIQGDKK